MSIQLKNYAQIVRAKTSKKLNLQKKNLLSKQLSKILHKSPKISTKKQKKNELTKYRFIEFPKLTKQRNMRTSKSVPNVIQRPKKLERNKTKETIKGVS